MDGCSGNGSSEACIFLPVGYRSLSGSREPSLVGFVLSVFERRGCARLVVPGRWLSFVGLIGLHIAFTRDGCHFYFFLWKKGCICRASSLQDMTQPQPHAGQKWKSTPCSIFPRPVPSLQPTSISRETPLHPRCIPLSFLLLLFLCKPSSCSPSSSHLRFSHTTAQAYPSHSTLINPAQHPAQPIQTSLSGSTCAP